MLKKNEFWPQNLKLCSFWSYGWIFMGPKYVVKQYPKFEFLQKFLTPDRNFCHLSRLKQYWFFAFFSILRSFPLGPQKFLGGKIGQMWATWASLPKKKENINKSWKMMILSISEKKKNLKFFDPQMKIFKNKLRAVEISADLKIFRIVNLGPKESPDMRVLVFLYLFFDILTLEWNFYSNFWPFFALREALLTH